jgi:hypothetical protein
MYMIHPDTELKFINEEVGYGVVAKALIPAGTIIWVRDPLDREFKPGEVEAMEPALRAIVENYTYRDSRGNYILCWDHGRFVNHSFKANCCATPYDFELAVRDIHPGEQLTDDYGYLNIIEPFWAADEGTERKCVFPDDLRRFHTIWDGQIKAVFGQICQLAQPLRPFMKDELWKHIVNIVDGEEQLASILENFYDEAFPGR